MSNTDSLNFIEEYNKRIVETPVCYVALNELLATFFVLFKDSRFKFFVWPLLQNVISVLFQCSTFEEAQKKLLDMKLDSIFSDDIIDDYAKVKLDSEM